MLPILEEQPEAVAKKLFLNVVSPHIFVGDAHTGALGNRMEASLLISMGIKH